MKTKSTSEKYYEFLKSLSERQRGFNSIGKIVSKAKLCNLIGSMLIKDGHIEKSSGVWRCFGPAPTILLAEKIYKSINDKLMQYHKPGKKSKDKHKPTRPKANRAYIKRQHGNPAKQRTSSDVLDLAALRQERINILSRVEKIDKVLEVAAGM